MSDDARGSVRRELLFVLLLGLLSRLLAYPFAMTQDGDVPGRIGMALDWLASPTLIYYGFWGPLHTYLVGAALWLYPDPVLSPIVISILATVATAGLLYNFVRLEFDRRAALWVACAFLFYPIAFRNSLMALAEPPFVFFVILCLWSLARARRPGGPWWMAAVAGLALTLAGALRFETWILIPVLGIFLWRTPRRLLLFWACASLFPVFWLAGNAIHFGDPLYSIHFTTRWVNEKESYNEGVSAGMKLIRWGFYPLMLWCGLTPPIFLLSLCGLALALRRKKPYVLWAIPLLVMAAVLQVNTVRGTIAIKGRYVHLAGVLLLPFLAGMLESGVVRRWPARRLRRWAVLLVLAMVPLGYAGNPVPGLFGGFYRKFINPVPRVGEPGPAVLALVRTNLDPQRDGLVLDFFGWDPSAYVALESRLPPAQLMAMPGAKNEPVNFRALNYFLMQRPRGLLVLKAGSRLAAGLGWPSPRRVALPEGLAVLNVKRLGTVGDVTVYRYLSVQLGNRGPTSC